MKQIHLLIALLLCGSFSASYAQTGIGTISPDPNFALHVVANGSQDPILLEGLKPGTSESSVLVINARGKISQRPATDLFSGSSLWVNNSGDISPLSNRQVGIGQTAVDAGLILGVTGHQRMAGSSQLQFRDNSNFIYSPTNNDYWYFKGNDYVSFRNSSNTSGVLTVRAVDERVGILTDEPDVAFHVGSSGSLSPVGGGVARFGSPAFVGLSQNQIGAYIGTVTSPLHLQQFGNRLIIGAGNPATSILDARGSARIGMMPPVVSDDFVLTANATGDIQKITWANAIAALGDNLGNHRATQNVFVEAEHQIQFNSADKYINRFGQDIDLVNLSGGAHVHAENLIVTNENIEAIAYFDGATQRVGFGQETVPDATVHIHAISGDLPLRIEDYPIAQGGGRYRQLIIDTDGYVYAARRTVSQNGSFDDKDPPGSLRIAQRSNIDEDESSTLNFTSGVGHLVQELQQENTDLRNKLMENAQEQRKEMLDLQSQLSALKHQIDKLYSETGIQKDQENKLPHGKACSHDH